MLHDELLGALAEIPLIDIHSHLPRDDMVATDASKLLFYHMLQYPLRAAGADEAALWPGSAWHSRACPYEVWDRCGPAMMRTGFGWILQSILRDLYEFDEPPTREAIPRLESAIARQASEGDWGMEVLRRARVEAVLSSAQRPQAPGATEALPIHDTVEVAASSGTREFDGWPQRLAQIAQSTGHEIANRAQFREAVRLFFDAVDWTGKTILVQWISSLADFRPADHADINRILAACCRGEAPAPEAAAWLEAELIRATLESVRDRIRVYQFCYGTQFVTPGPGRGMQRAAPQFASGMAHLIAQFPEIHFNVLNGFEADEPIWCSLPLAYDNVSLGGYWWQTFYPWTMQAAWQRRLDMVPTTRLMGFFSDGYCVEWIYGRATMTRRVLANVLAERIERGFCTRDQALSAARDVLYETPKRICFA